MAALSLRSLTSLPVASTSFLIPPLSSLLPEWLLRAVPKKKVSHSRKSMRSANKGLQEKTNISTCASCGLAKRAHHFCPNCYSAITRRWKSIANQREAPSSETESISTLASAVAVTIPEEGRSVTERIENWLRGQGVAPMPALG